MITSFLIHFHTITPTSLSHHQKKHFWLCLQLGTYHFFDIVITSKSLSSQSVFQWSEHDCQRKRDQGCVDNAVRYEICCSIPLWISQGFTPSDYKNLTAVRCSSTLQRTKSTARLYIVHTPRHVPANVLTFVKNLSSFSRIMKFQGWIGKDFREV